MKTLYPPFFRRLTLYLLAITLLPLLLLSSYILIRTAIARLQAPEPQVILLLGGGTEREDFAARFAQANPDLDIWVSAGTAKAASIFAQADIPRARLHLDCRATDTVTNFTTVVHDLQQRNIHHVYLLTTDFQSQRAAAIGTLVFGSQGITFTPVTQTTHQARDSNRRTLRDIGRSLAWMFTGWTGEKYNGRDRSVLCKAPGYRLGIFDQ